MGGCVEWALMMWLTNLAILGSAAGRKGGGRQSGRRARCGDRLKIFCFSNRATSSPREVLTTLPSLYISPRHQPRPVLLLLSPSISCHHLPPLSSHSARRPSLQCPLFARLPPSPSLVLPPSQLGTFGLLRRSVLHLRLPSVDASTGTLLVRTRIRPRRRDPVL